MSWKTRQVLVIRGKRLQSSNNVVVPVARQCFSTVQSLENLRRLENFCTLKLARKRRYHRSPKKKDMPSFARAISGAVTLENLNLLRFAQFEAWNCCADLFLSLFTLSREFWMTIWGRKTIPIICSYFSAYYTFVEGPYWANFQQMPRFLMWLLSLYCHHESKFLVLQRNMLKVAPSQALSCKFYQVWA